MPEVNSLFEQIKQGLNEAIAYERGEISAHTVVISIRPLDSYAISAKNIRELRLSHSMTQKMFAEFMGVSVKTVEAWESGKNHPSGTALRLMQILSDENNRFVRVK